MLNTWILRCAGPQGTITVSVNGQLQPLSGSFSVSAAQPATTAPELVSTLPSGHSLQGSGGSLIKVNPPTCRTIMASHTCIPSFLTCQLSSHDIAKAPTAITLMCWLVCHLCGLGSEPEEPGMARLMRAWFQGVTVVCHFENMAPSVRSQGWRM